jgi:peptide/nickel transport system substrate-binding protein
VGDNSKGTYWDSVTRERIGRRRLLKSGATLSMGAAALALIGCGGDDAGGEAADDGGDPVPGGTLRWGMFTDLVSLDPWTIISGQFDTLWQIWDGMTEYDKSAEPSPRLATEWEINGDSTEFVFHTREGVTWHDGRAFTSEDVAQILRLVADPERQGAVAQLRVMAQWYSESIEVPDANTIIFRTTTPRPAVFDFFSQLRIADPRTVDNVPKKAIGTGPFRFGEWRQGERFNILKNPDYWNPARPLLDEQVFNVSLDPQSAIQQFEAGALDVVQEPPDRDFAALRDDYQGLLHSSSGAFYCVGYNCIASGGSPEALRDKRVRQALNWAIDRERLAEVVLLGNVKPYSLPWPEGSMAYEEDKANHYEFDLDKAKELLEEAGVDGFDCKIFVYTGLPAMVDFAEIYQQDLAEIGVTTEIEAVEVATWAARVNENPPNYNGIYAANSFRANFALPVTMANLGQALWSTTGVNNTGYFSEEWKAVIDEFNVTTDPVRQEELSHRMNDILLDGTWITFVAPRPPKVLLQNNVRGVYNYFAREGFEYADAWLDV